MAELPLRIIDQPGGLVIRCLCGAEAAVVKPAPPVAAIVRAGHSMRRTNRTLSPDGTPAAVLRMALHAQQCLPGHNKAAELAPDTTMPPRPT
jgi:hypothetical protein